MERVAKLLAGSRVADGVTPEQIAMAAWPAAVGKKIAAKTQPVSVVRGKLIVSVEDFVWQSQLWPLRSQILKNLEKLTGPNIVTDLEFRLNTARRGPVREYIPVRAADDESAAISDPVLGRLYRNSRARSSAHPAAESNWKKRTAS
jgi:hypothetical protein